MSVSAVNQFVQQLIEREFQVFGDSAKIDEKEKHAKERQQLESSLKVLKVLHYLCRHSNLFSGQGVRFLVSTYASGRSEEEDNQEAGFQDIDLQVGLSCLQANLFHHHKLDGFILKNIQDPYNLISGAVSEQLQQIFKQCSFLFPF